MILVSSMCRRSGVMFVEVCMTNTKLQIQAQAIKLDSTVHDG